MKPADKLKIKLYDLQAAIAKENANHQAKIAKLNAKGNAILKDLNLLQGAKKGGKK